MPIRDPSDVRSPSLAPVIVFAYGRVDHLQSTLDALRRNEEAAASELYVFSDGARRPQDAPRVDEVRRLVDGLSGFASIHRIYRESNLGLAQSVIDGVTTVLAAHGRAVVLEDDIVVSPHFLRYMNDGLNRYADDPRVASVHAYSYPTHETLPETFFLQGADCWGWGTWSRAWSTFEADGARLLAELKRRRLTHHFDFDGTYPFTRMLEDQVAGRNSSWAIRWYAACYLEGLLTLYPGRSLVENIGNDASGTHCEVNDALSSAPTSSPVDVGDAPVAVDDEARAVFVRFLRRQQTWKSKLRSSMARVLSHYA